jgi:muconate cycloisomerase
MSDLAIERVESLETTQSSGVTYGSELFGPLLMREELLTVPPRHPDGDLHPAERPGLDVELDPAAVPCFRRS